MDNTVTERQRRYKNRMYKAGFKRIYIWVKRKEPNYKTIKMTEFIRKIKMLTRGLDSDNLSLLLNLCIKIAKSRKEEVKLIKKR